MEKIYLIILLNCFFVHNLSGQTLVEQIENAYRSLDSMSYNKDVISSYEKYLLKSNREAEDLRLELRKAYHPMDTVPSQQMLDSIMAKSIVPKYKENLLKQKVWEEIFTSFGKAIANAYLKLDGSIQRQSVYDSIIREFSEISMDKSYTEFVSSMKYGRIHYVLNLRIDSCDQSICLLPETGTLPFNLFSFGKNYKGGFYIYFTGGEFGGYDNHYRTFSRRLGINAQKVFKKIMHKRPKYLLYCAELEQMNTILYMRNDMIYVYRIVQMEEYELGDYMNKFKPVPGRF